MVSKFKSIALAGALVFVAAPAFAQQGVPVVGDLPIINDLPLVGNNGGGVDVDPFHIFTPAAAPEGAAPMMKKKMMMHHRMMHKKMMMKKPMMHKTMMMRKKGPMHKFKKDVMG